VIQVRQIPATFDGLARFNVMNAVQAIAGCYAEGVPPATIRDAMSKFSMSAENTPWRLNFYEGLPFKVLVDFAHNPDGLKRIAEFTDGIQTQGRKLVAFSGFRSERQIKLMSEAVANHYDHYVLKNYGKTRYSSEEERDEFEIPHKMRKVLQDSGVNEDQISIIPDEMKAMTYCLNMAQPGDLVVLLLGYSALKGIKEFMDEYIAGYGSTG
jgi:cyanophycin synthetase